jgi:hypothetical protein
MSHPERPIDDPLLRVLRAHLERQEQTLDVEPLAARLLGRQASDPRLEPARPLKRPWAKWSLGLGTVGIAAALLLVVFLMPSAEVRAEQAIRQAEEALRLPVERCYLVEVRPDGDGVGEDVLPTRTMRVWAAEDKFRVEMTRGTFRWSWGRDGDGVVWLTSNHQRGLRIAPDEQGPGLLWMAELYGLRPETLLSQILAHCRLREDARPGSNYPRVIHAEPRATARQVWLRSATLELDAETKAVRKLTLKRANKADGDTTTVTFTLIDTRPVEHARYGLEGNLVEPFHIYDRDVQPERRREILARWVGPHLDAWLKPVTKK